MMGGCDSDGDSYLTRGGHPGWVDRSCLAKVRPKVCPARGAARLRLSSGDGVEGIWYMVVYSCIPYHKVLLLSFLVLSRTVSGFLSSHIFLP